MPNFFDFIPGSLAAPFPLSSVCARRPRSTMPPPTTPLESYRSKTKNLNPPVFTPFRKIPPGGGNPLLEIRSPSFPPVTLLDGPVPGRYRGISMANQGKLRTPEMPGYAPPSPAPRPELERYYQALYSALGPQHWWPARTPFEVIVGAILTQNTAWTNVERAIANLRRARLLTPAALERVDQRRVARPNPS